MDDRHRRRSAIFLWIVWAILLGWSSLGPAPGTARWLRVASSAALVFASWTFAAGAGRRRSGSPLLWTAIGMTLGSLGDAWSLVPEERLPVHRLIPAMALFGLGHLAYIVGFLRASRNRADSPARSAAVLAFWLVIVALAWQWSINMTSAPPVLRWSALGYSAILGSTTAAGTRLALGQRSYLPVAVGTILFLISDIILGIQSFRGGFPFDTELCWATYGPGQMLIVYGMAWAAATMSGRGLAEKVR